jgi:hypothetical protein
MLFGVVLPTAEKRGDRTPEVTSGGYFPVYFNLVIRIVFCLKSRVPHMEEERLTLPEYMSSLPVFSWIRVARSSVFCVMFTLHPVDSNSWY